MMLFFILITSFIVALLVLNIFMVVSMKFATNEMKMSPFECGFTPRENSRSSFSNQFFLVALVFLIFDIELILLFPFLVSMNFSEYFSLKLFWWFILILMLGLLFEWGQKSLEWKK